MTPAGDPKHEEMKKGGGPGLGAAQSESDSNAPKEFRFGPALREFSDAAGVLLAAAADEADRGLKKAADRTEHAVKQGVDSAANRLFSDPGGELRGAEEAKQKMFAMTETVSGTAAYERASDRYWTGVAESDQGKIDKAVRECLLAYASAGFDIATLAPGMLSKSSSILAKVTGGFTLTRLAKALGEVDIGLLDSMAGKILQKCPDVEARIRAVLEQTSPERKAPHGSAYYRDIGEVPDIPAD